MRGLVVALALVVGVLALVLVWVNRDQAETIALLREQNTLLWAQVRMERRLISRVDDLNGSYHQILTDVGYWLGLEVPPGVGGP